MPRNKGAHMPRVEGLTAVSRRDPEAVLTEHVPSEMPAGEQSADQLVGRTGWVLEDAELQEQAIHAHDGGSAPAAPARSVARGASRRGARAIGVQPHATARATARRASSTSSSTTQGAPLVISLRA